jgi:hypothetical protein
MHRVAAPDAPLTRSTASRLTASNCSSNLTRSWPPSPSPHSLDYSVQRHLETRLITDLEFISKPAWSLPASVPPNVHEYRIEVRMIKPHSLSPNSVDPSLQVYVETYTVTSFKCNGKVAHSWPWRSGNPGLQGHRKTDEITASMWNSEVAQLQPPSGSQTKCMMAGTCISIIA